MIIFFMDANGQADSGFFFFFFFWGGGGVITSYLVWQTVVGVITSCFGQADSGGGDNFMFWPGRQPGNVIQ